MTFPPRRHYLLAANMLKRAGSRPHSSTDVLMETPSLVATSKTPTKLGFDRWLCEEANRDRVPLALLSERSVRRRATMWSPTGNDEPVDGIMDLRILGRVEEACGGALNWGLRIHGVPLTFQKREDRLGKGPGVPVSWFSVCFLSITILPLSPRGGGRRNGPGLAPWRLKKRTTCVLKYTTRKADNGLRYLWD